MGLFEEASDSISHHGLLCFRHQARAVKDCNNGNERAIALAKVS